jgi:formylglycine-generating enzyme required for sulfatase activity
MVEPLTMALFAAAELVLGKLGGKALDAILEPTDELLKSQVKALTGRDLSKVRQNAFQEALKKARDDFLAAVSETDAELAGRLITVFCPEDEESARDLELPPQFIVEAQKVDLFAEQPDLGALLEGYRQADATWWMSRDREVPEPGEVERLLQDFLAFLRQRLRDDPVWGPLSLTAAKLRAVEHIDETLTEELPTIRKMTEELPAIRKLVARLEETMRQTQGQLPRRGLGETTGAYLTYLRDRYQYLAFRGMGLSERVPLKLPLVEMYVPLSARPELPPGETWERKRLQLAGRELDEEAMGARTGEPQPLLALLTEEREGLIILGDPGAGKTTFLLYLAVQLAQGRGEELDLGVERLPILLPLSAYAAALAEADVSLDDFLPRYYRDQNVRLDLRSLFEAALQSGQAVVLLDGLDEVRLAQRRQQVVDQVEDFITWHRGRGNRFVITSRIVGYREAPLSVEGLTECTLADFDDEEIRQFAERWCAALGETEVAEWEAERECAEFLATVNRNPGVRRLAANPLLLTILALMKRQGVALPERRAELYDTYVDTLLRTWNLARSLAPGRQREMKMEEVAETVRVLASLALWMHETNPGVGLAPRGDVERQLVAHYGGKGASLEQAEDRTARFLADVREHAGLFLERGSGTYGFIHLTFEEYLAAMAIARQGQLEPQKTVDKLCQHLAEPEWREVILLTVGYLGIVQQWEELASRVVEGILAHELSGDERGLNVVVAGQATLDVRPAGVTAETQQTVVQRLQDTMTASDVSPVVRAHAGRVLGQLGDPREGVCALELAWEKACPEPSRRVAEGLSIARYPVTSAQYRLFVEEGGYQNPAYWPEAIEAGDWKDGTAGHLWGEGRTSPVYWDDPRWNISNHPVVGINWYEAVAYCRWLTEELRALGTLGRDEVVRMPTEAEWQQAAQGEDGREYPWGRWQERRANTRESGIEQTSAVGLFPEGASPCRALDMAGNVWEWCADWYDEDRNFKVLRGGSWLVNQGGARCIYRDGSNPWYGGSNVGFRCARGSL